MHLQPAQRQALLELISSIAVAVSAAAVLSAAAAAPAASSAATSSSPLPVESRMESTMESTGEASNTHHQQLARHPMRAFVPQWTTLFEVPIGHYLMSAVYVFMRVFLSEYVETLVFLLANWVFSACLSNGCI